MDGNPTRVIIRAHLKDIPGDPLNRVNSLGSAFCEQVLCRPVNFKVQVEGYDTLHVPPNFDSENDISVWFLYDFNVTGRVDKDKIFDIPHQVYLATRQNDSWIFTLRNHWIDKTRKYAAQHPWGGRREQDLLDAMREDKD